MKIIVVSEEDPVARGVSDVLGPGEPTDLHIGDSRLRSLGEERFVLRRPGLHIHDDALGREIPPQISVRTEALIFPSVHRSESDRPSLTVHPLGNLTGSAEVGGRPGELNPVPARLMTEAFLRWHETGEKLGIGATFEATHHGPLLPLPSFFIEIGSTSKEWDRQDLTRSMAELLSDLEIDRTGKGPVLLGVGGGHYMPRFRDLVRKRQFSVGHLVPSHHLGALSKEMEEQLVARTHGVSGVLYAKDPGASTLGRLKELLPEVRERDLSPR